MEQKISTKKIQQALDEMKDISRLEYLLFSKKGKFVAGTTEIPEKKLADSVVLFAESPAESQVVQGWMFLRVEIREETEYVLLVTRTYAGGGDDPYVIGRMAVCQLRNMILSVQEPLDQNFLLKQLLLGEVQPENVEEKAYQLNLKKGMFQIFVIQFSREKDSTVFEMVRNLFVSGREDYLVDMDDTRIVLIKSIQHMDAEAGQYAQIMVDNIQAEAMCNVWVGYSKILTVPNRISSNYLEACMALTIGRRFYGESHVFDYYYMGIGRLVYQLPEDLCEIFLQEVLGDNAETEFDEETLTTINHLFDNSLNISETARQLYIHRNTLVYRLERIEKRLGLDIRAFEDAMLFKLAMLVRVQLRELRKRS